jgi:GT2 family glycosyltransferase
MAALPCKPPSRIPRASVIIVNFNGRDHLDQCIGSLLAGDLHDCEIIVVDNASTDRSAEHVERYYPQVRVIRNGKNGGFGHGNNLGAQWAQGEFLAFVNPDAAVEPSWLNALIAALEADPQAGLATSRILMLTDPERINLCANDVHYTGLTLCRGLGMERDKFADIGEVSAVSGAAFAIRREVFEALGGFDERFFLYMEDTDLSWRARLAGHRCLYVPHSMAYHDYSLRFGPHKTFYQERNRYQMLLKNLRWRTLLVLLPALVLAEAVTWGFVLLKDRRRVMNKLRAYTWIVKHWHEVMESRRRVQATRRTSDRDLVAGCIHTLAFEQTGEGIITRIAHLVFDPLFFALQRLALALTR